jgi:concanavalin A-like lectin/glucanase superfamily protein
MLRRNLGWVCVCGGALAACAQLAGFEEFKEGEASGGTAMTEAGAAGIAGAPSAGKGGTSANAGAGSGAGAAVGGAAASGGTAGRDPQSGGGAPSDAGAPPTVGDGGEPGLLSGCVLLMHFEEAGWSMKPGEVQDSSGLGNHGTPSSASLTTSTAAQGKFGRAAKFDGSGGVVVADAPSLRANGALTVAAWIRPTALDPNGPGIVAKRRGFGSDTAFALFLYDAAFHLYGDVQGEESRFNTLKSFAVDNWYHVALVFDGSAAESERSSLYVNGMLDVTSGEPSTQIEPYTSDVVIGNLIGGGAPFSGLIDEVAIWTRALGPGEVHDVFAAAEPL